MLETLGAVVARSDLQGRWLELSPGLCSLLGCGSAEYLGEPWLNLVHPDDSADLPADTGTPLVLEPIRRERRFKVCREDAHEWLWLLHATRLVVDDAGRPQYREHVLLDIGQRKHQELDLLDQAGLLDSLSRHVPGLIYKLEARPDGSPRVAYVNEGVRDIFELDPEVVVADFAQIVQRIHPDDQPMFEALLSTALQTQESTEFEFRVVLPVKGLRYLGGRALSGRQSNGRMARFGYLHDVTEHKLYQEATVQARAAQEASEAKSEFLSRMSHELRTPLNAILGFAQVLRLSEQEPLSTAQRNKVEVMEQAGRHLLAVINDVLDLSRIEAGRLPLAVEAVSVNEAFRKAVGLIGHLPETSHVTIKPWQGPELGVAADPVRLHQVLVNLLSNAIKYNREGGVVTLDAWRDDDRVVLQVADTGCGITPEQQSRMFEPFNRLGAEEGPVEGTGIGLVIVRRLLQLMHGDVEVHSTAGQGTEVTFWLPCVPLPEPLQGPASSPPQPGPGPLARTTTPAGPKATTPMSVLYVEDNEVNIELVVEVLSMCSYCELTVARSGHEALEMVRARRPDLLLLDMQLGDMTGFDVVRLLDREPETTGIPRVALSADAMPDSIRQAQAWGFKSYLTKPVDVMDLVATMDSLSAEMGKR